MGITIVIIGLIGVYSFFVLRKKYQDMRKGRFCSCGCQDCPSKCHEYKEEGCEP